MPQKIALFGGAFDPIHNGHIRLALEFARRLKLDQVLLMPSYVPPHKLRSDMAGASDRLEMCRLAAGAARRPCRLRSGDHPRRRQLYGGYPRYPAGSIPRRVLVSHHGGGHVFDPRQLVAVPGYRGRGGAVRRAAGRCDPCPDAELCRRTQKNPEQPVCSRIFR